MIGQKSFKKFKIGISIFYNNPKMVCPYLYNIGNMYVRIHYGNALHLIGKDSTFRFPQIPLSIGFLIEIPQNANKNSANISHHFSKSQH